MRAPTLTEEAMKYRRFFYMAAGTWLLGDYKGEARSN